MFYPALDVSEVEPVNVLAVSARPNDAEWFCGGTLRALAEQGKRTGILDLSAGDMSPRGIPRHRLTEADDAARILGVGWRGNLGLPDGRLENNIITRMTLAGILRTLKPRTVIGPHPDRRHPDHRHLWNMLREASYAAGWPKLDDSIPPHRPAHLLRGAPDVAAAPSFVMPLSREHLEAKIEALLAYRSQFESAGTPEGFEDPLEFPTAEHLRELATGFASVYGFGAGLGLAEPFFTEAPFVGAFFEW